MTDSRRVLVVDDNATNLLLAKALLSKLGWVVSQAESGEAALALVDKEQFSVILLDISMPGLSGEETCTLLRQRPDGASMRIIAYTAHAFADERDRFLAAGFNEILVKPVTLQSVSAVLAKLAG